MKVPFYDIGATYNELQYEINQAVDKILKSGWYVLGEQVKLFEQEYSRFCGVEHCIGVSSGLDALKLILEAWNISKGDEVIVPAHTFIATWIPITSLGAIPVPVEIDEKTFNINPKFIENVISSKTKAIIPVHLYGQLADMTEINALAKKYNLKVLEDAAQSHGAKFNGDVSGSFGTAAAFSFYPGKNLGAFGDGGAITTDNYKLAKKIRSLRNYGSEKKYIHSEIGYNNRLDELQAGILRVKLKYLNDWNERRKKIAKSYLKNIINPEIQMPFWTGMDDHVFHLFVLRCKKRNLIIEKLNEKKIQTLIHYPIPPYKQKAYLDYNKYNFEITEKISQEILSIPISPVQSTDQTNYIIETINKL